MYQDSNRSKQAKMLRTALKAKGVQVTHAQCLQLTAQLEGHRTLHVAYSKPTKELAIDAAVHAQAQALMFDSLGHYEGRFDELMADLHKLESLDDARAADQLFRSIIRCHRPVVVSDLYGNLNAEELPKAYDRLVEKLRSSLVKSAQRETDGWDQVFSGSISDWEKEEGVLEDGDARPDYDLSIKRNGSQFIVDVTPKGSTQETLAGKPQLSLFVEVNRGVPCVHVSNDLWGDQLLTIFGLSSGLYLQPDSLLHSIRTGAPTPGTDLEKFHEGMKAMTGYVDAFIENNNAS